MHARTPAYGKWWGKDWQQSTLRYELKTIAQRGAYREFHDLCLWSPDVGWAVTGAGRPLTINEIAQMIGARVDLVRRVIETGEAHGKIVRRADDALGLDRESVEKSLPDHSVYKRLRAKRSDGSPTAVRAGPPANQSQNQIHDDDDKSSSSTRTSDDDPISADRHRVLAEFEIGGAAQIELAKRVELTPGRIREVCQRAHENGGRGGVMISRLRAEADRIRDRGISNPAPVDSFAQYEAEARDMATADERAAGLDAMKRAMRHGTAEATG